MWKLIDKGILFLLVTLLLAPNAFPLPGALVLLFAILTASLSGYWEKPRLVNAAIGGYLAVCLLFPVFCLGLPLVLYDGYPTFKGASAYAALPVFLLHFTSFPLRQAVLCVVLCALSLLLSLRASQIARQKGSLLRLRDESYEQQLRLEQRNKNLMEQQDYEIHIATLNERNRIAREIHDNVGHMLSRSILQTGAIMAMSRDPALSENLIGLKSTLDSAMDSIRISVHDLHDESIRLEECLRLLEKEYRFCPVRLVYDVEHDLPRGLKYCFLSIAREALSNTARHSNATALTIVLREHPGLYQLVISDNGTRQASSADYGIGLSNMEERLRPFHGAMRITQKDGFRIFISVPREKEEASL